MKEKNLDHFSLGYFFQKISCSAGKNLIKVVRNLSLKMLGMFLETSNGIHTVVMGQGQNFLSWVG